ncbi:helix-turn-helix transcriptional regulator [Allobranchiibius sp. GilTou38]|uniref:helix-turn-helix transcriptional regulator n=1 Tax=Allobranchiibius sp. GilTou38 TaxID=2815210 RepID=UPI001AA1669E|nr:helix-turn-helix transcriptional regulator [Allobranchiibius sp. GilTou38]MBO1768242.1 helix-turn-helix transcriptional regulator [Allobranchiibius sp. GilTou38]
MRRTETALRVADEFLSRPGDKHWGYETSKATGIRSGSLYPILTRFLDAEWITDGWEDPAATGGRPPRRYYELTDRGRAEMGGFVAGARIQASAIRSRLRPLGGTA